MGCLPLLGLLWMIAFDQILSAATTTTAGLLCLAGWLWWRPQVVDALCVPGLYFALSLSACSSDLDELLVDTLTWKRYGGALVSCQGQL